MLSSYYLTIIFNCIKTNITHQLNNICLLWGIAKKLLMFYNEAKR